MQENINNITQELLKYENTDNKSWLEVYKEILNKLNLTKEFNNNDLLINVIKEITSLGFDINPYPYSLEKYR